MRLVLQILIGVAVAGCASAPPTEIAFTASRAQFVSGDSIVIEHVYASASPIKVGDRVTVKGHYTLSGSGDAALVLGLYAATPPSDESITAGIAALKQEIASTTRQSPIDIQPESMNRVFAGTGRFELSIRPRKSGELAVVFVPSRGGQPFGGVFFASVRDK